MLIDYRDIILTLLCGLSLTWLYCGVVTHDGEDATMHSVDEDKEYPCLIRLTNGKDVNYSTHVSS